MITFPQIYISFKTHTSNIILWWGYGMTSLVSLIVSIIIGYKTIQLYEVPIKDVQIYAHKVLGGEEKDYSLLEMKMDYGLGLTKKYKKSYEPGIRLYIYQTDDWRKNDSVRAVTFRSYINKATGRNFSYNYKEVLKYLKNREIQKFGNDEFMNSVMSIFAVHSIESKLPRTNFEESPIDSFEIYKTKPGVKIGEYKIQGEEKLSAVYQKTFFMVDSITGLDSYGSMSYVAFRDSGENRPVVIPNSPSLTKPSLFSLFDISQSYFRFTIGVPSDMRGTLLDFDFGGATDFSKIYPEPDLISMSGFAYNDPDKISYIYDRGLWFHATFKQMENIQIIRMFVMTTLLGFFVALSFTSAFKGLKYASRRYRIRRLKDGEKTK